MELRIVGRDGHPPRLVDLDGPAELHPDDRILGPDGQPLGHADGDPAGVADQPAAGHEPWSANWTAALERDLGRWLNRNGVDAAVGVADWQLARLLLVQLFTARALGPQTVYMVNNDPPVIPWSGPVPDFVARPVTAARLAQ